MAKMTISLEDALVLELAKMARDEHVTENDLVREAINRLLQAHRGPGTPRFARRLGPLAIAEDARSVAEGTREPTPT